MQRTRRSRASRVAEVSRFKKWNAAAIGFKTNLCLQEVPRNLTPSRLCSLTSSSLCFIPDQCFSAFLRPSQLIAIFAPLFNSSQSCSMSPLLSPTLFTSSLLFSTLPKDSHLCHLLFTLLNSFHLPSTHLTSCHCFNSSHHFSPPLNSSHLFLSSSQLF